MFHITELVVSLKDANSVLPFSLTGLWSFCACSAYLLLKLEHFFKVE